MSLKTSTYASIFIACCMMVAPSNAQLVNKLGKMPIFGKVKQAGFFSDGCDSCVSGPSCGIAGCDDPSCGCAAPSCGLAGSILGGCLGAGPGGCGASIEPSCGSTGLGYGGGFGLCGGSCDACGDGGYFGRNLRRVNPCACGGSLIGDMARGLLTLVDRAVGATVATVFGGLQRVTCHASGTFAALECAAAAACGSCGMVDCDGCGMGPSCGIADPACGCDLTATCDGPACGVPATLAAPETYPSTSVPNYGTPTYAPSTNGGYSQPTAPTPAPATELMPTPANGSSNSDPFLDDVVPTPQARFRATPRAPGYRVYGTPTLAAPQVAGQRTAAGVKPAAYATPTANRYLQAQRRPLTLRR